MAEPHLPASLSDALIPSAQPSTYYIPNFLSPTEQSHLLQKINSVPLPTWKHLTHRRLQAHPSQLSNTNTLLAAPLPKWLSDPIVPRLLSIPLTSPAAHDERSDAEKSVFGNAPHGGPNHCLINEYTPGQGIHPHEDGMAYYPVVATVSLGAPIVLDVYRKPASGEPLDAKPADRIFQEPGSLLISTGSMYTGYLHGIRAVEVDEDLHEGEGGIVNWGMVGREWRDKVEENGGRWRRGVRVSATFRDVVKVRKLGGLGVLGGGGRK